MLDWTWGREASRAVAIRRIREEERGESGFPIRITIHVNSLPFLFSVRSTHGDLWKRRVSPQGDKGEEFITISTHPVAA